MGTAGAQVQRESRGFKGFEVLEDHRVSKVHGPAGATGGTVPRYAEQVRQKLIQVDGAGSKIDADRFDGMDSAEFVRLLNVLTRLLSVDGQGSGVDADLFDGFDSDIHTAGAQIIDRIQGVDGSGSGLDADRLDGIDSTEFVRTAAPSLPC